MAEAPKIVVATNNPTTAEMLKPKLERFGDTVILEETSTWGVSVETQRANIAAIVGIDTAIIDVQYALFHKTIPVMKPSGIDGLLDIIAQKLHQIRSTVPATA